MSLVENQSNIEIKVDLDNRVLPQSAEKMVYSILKGPQLNSYTLYPTTSYSDNTISFTFIPNDIKNYMDRRAFMIVEGTFTVTTTGRSTPIFGDSTGPYPQVLSNPSLGGFAALRPLPIQYVCNSYSCNLGSAAYSCQPNLILDAMLRYGKNQLNEAMTNVGNALILDNYNTYEEAAGKVNNPLLEYGSSYLEGRGSSYETLSITNVSANQSIINISWLEPLVLFPFTSLFNKDVNGITGISTCSITFSLADIENMLCINKQAIGLGNDVSVTATVTQNVSQKPTLIIDWLTSPVKAEQNLKNNFYSASNAVQYSQPYNIPYKSSLIVTSQTIQTQSLPSDLYIFGRINKNAYKPYTADSYLGISNISVNIGNNTGMLSSSTPGVLYSICARNGYVHSYNQFLKYGCCVIRLNLQKDISMLEGDAVGIDNQYTIQVKANVYNTNPDVTDWDFTILPINEQLLSIQNGNSQLSLATFDKRQVLKSALETGEVSDKTSSKVFFGGSNFTRKLKKAAAKIGDMAKKYGPDVVDAVKKYGPEAAKLVATYGPVALSLLGAGMSIEEINDHMQGGALDGYGLDGYGFQGNIGGKMIKPGNRKLGRKIRSIRRD